jgi:hypothetical protein
MIRRPHRRVRGIRPLHHWTLRQHALDDLSGTMPSPTQYAADLDAVREAAERIAPYARRTPVMRSRVMDEMAGRELLFKCEMFQRVGRVQVPRRVQCGDEAR